MPPFRVTRVTRVQRVRGGQLVQAINRGALGRGRLAHQHQQRGYQGQEERSFHGEGVGAGE